MSFLYLAEGFGPDLVTIEGRAGAHTVAPSARVLLPAAFADFRIVGDDDLKNRVARGNRSQFRIQFYSTSFSDGQNDRRALHPIFHADKPTLVIDYEYAAPFDGP